MTLQTELAPVPVLSVPGNPDSDTYVSCISVLNVYMCMCMFKETKRLEERKVDG